MQIVSFKNSDMDFSRLDEKNPYYHIIQDLKEIFPKLSGLNILDIGCGRDRKYQGLDFLLAEAGCIVIGTDIECKNKRISRNLRFVRCAAEAISAKISGQFDAIVSAYFFGYVTKDWSISNGMDVKAYESFVMQALHSLLKPGGISINYMHEPWVLEKGDLINLGFDVLQFPTWSKINPLEDGICVLAK